MYVYELTLWVAKVTRCLAASLKEFKCGHSSLLGWPLLMQRVEGCCRYYLEELISVYQVTVSKFVLAYYFNIDLLLLGF